MPAEFQQPEAQQRRRVTELWRGPFVRLLTDELPDYERRDLLNKLQDAGTFRNETSARESRTRFRLSA